MKFEIGKYYRHSAGGDLSILCEANTTLYGESLLAERAGKLTQCGWVKNPDNPDGPLISTEGLI